MTKTKAITIYFSTDERPVSTKELLDLKRNDPAGWDELAQGAAAELGEALD